jgi:hypothetical protein
MSEEPKEPKRDYYAMGWEAGVEQARRILTTRLDRPDEALSMIQGLLVKGHQVRNGGPARKVTVDGARGSHW